MIDSIEKALERYFRKERIEFREQVKGVACAVDRLGTFYVNPNITGKQRVVEATYCLLGLTDKYENHDNTSKVDSERLYKHAEGVIDTQPFIGEQIERIIAEAERDQQFRPRPILEK